jgi:Ca2+-binding EF-hand superfamily protein
MPGEPPELTRRQARAVHAFLRETLKNERHIAMEQNFEPCDVNRDGVVTRAEAVRTMVEDDRHFSGGAEAKRAEALATFNWWDSDKDGRVGPREIRSAYAMRAARAVQAFTERLARVDRNGDGRISRAERLAEREQFMLDRFERQDTDGDGRLSPEEAIVPTDHAQANAAARKLFRKKDADGDGYVSRAEAIAHFRRNTRR